MESGWENVASDQQLVGRRVIGPEGRGFPEVCGPQCPDGLHPQWGHGQGLSPSEETTAALAQRSPEGVSNSDTVFYKGTGE